MINAGDIVEMKKPHPCGGSLFQVMRIGMDVRLKCQQCGSQIVLDRRKFNKAMKKQITHSESVDL